MKKLVTSAFILSLILSGCGEKTDYQKLVRDLDTASSQNAYHVTMVWEEGTKTSSKRQYNIDNEAGIISIETSNSILYGTSDTIYTGSDDDNLYKLSIGINNIPGFREINLTKSPFSGIPDGNFILDKEFTGIKEIDEALSRDKLESVIVSTEKHVYTIEGAEDEITIDLSGDPTITINFPGTDQTETMRFEQIDDIKLPDTVESAKDIPDYMLPPSLVGTGSNLVTS